MHQSYFPHTIRCMLHSIRPFVLQLHFGTHHYCQCQILSCVSVKCLCLCLIFPPPSLQPRAFFTSARSHPGHCRAPAAPPHLQPGPHSAWSAVLWRLRHLPSDTSSWPSWPFSPHRCKTPIVLTLSLKSANEVHDQGHTKFMLSPLSHTPTAAWGFTCFQLFPSIVLPID